MTTPDPVWLARCDAVERGRVVLVAETTCNGCREPVPTDHAAARFAGWRNMADTIDGALDGWSCPTCSGLARAYAGLNVGLGMVDAIARGHAKEGAAGLPERCERALEALTKTGSIGEDAAQAIRRARAAAGSDAELETSEDAQRHLRRAVVAIDRAMAGQSTLGHDRCARRGDRP